MRYDQKVTREEAQRIRNIGYRVFIAKGGTYGFYTDKKMEKVVSFCYDLGAIVYSGNYKSNDGRRCGNGWRLSNEENYQSMYNALPPQWAVGNAPYKLKTVKQYLKEYQRSSKFKELKTATFY